MHLSGDAGIYETHLKTAYAPLTLICSLRVYILSILYTEAFLTPTLPRERISPYSWRTLIEGRRFAIAFYSYGYPHLINYLTNVARHGSSEQRSTGLQV